LLNFFKKRLPTKNDHCCAFTWNDKGIGFVYATNQPEIEIKVCDYFPIETEKSARDILSKLYFQYDLTTVMCSWVLMPEQYKLLQIDDLDVPDNELKLAARWRVKDLLDFPHQEAAIDVFRVPGHGPGKHRKLLYAVAAKKIFLQKRLEILHALNFQISCVDVDILAIRNLMNMNAKENTNMAFLCLHAKEIQLLLAHNKNLYVIYRKEYEYDDLNNMDFFNIIALEIQRTYDYFTAQMGFSQPTLLMLSPTIVSCDELLSRLQEFFGNTVIQFDVNKIALYPKGMLSQKTQAKTLEAIGGVLCFNEGADVATN
jgi:MSHA biogenesis protein MshI